MKDNLSEKDLSYITDMFNWNYNIIETINLIESNVSDEKLLNLLNTTKKTHQNICESIKEVIN